MTLEQYRGRLGNLVNDLSGQLVRNVIVPPANELLATIKNRIVLDGKDSNDNKIGDYSTKPAYYTREQFDRRSSFKPQGKNARGDFQNGKKRKSMYIRDGYKGLREEQGKPTSTMVLNYSGSTMAAYQQTATDKEVLQGMTTELASQIRRGQEEKRDKSIYKASKTELEAFNKNVAIEFLDANIKILNGVSE